MIIISDYMFEELLNWRRWCLNSNQKHHCRSLEHRYIAESDLDRVATATTIVRNFDAMAIEKQLSSYTFPRKQRSIIIDRYIWRRPYQRTCKDNGLTFADYDTHVMRAVITLESRINKPIDKQSEHRYIKAKLAELATFTKEYSPSGDLAHVK